MSLLAMTDTDRENLVGNILVHLSGAQKRIQLRQCAIFFKADDNYGRNVARGLGLDLKEVELPAAMSKQDRAKTTQE